MRISAIRGAVAVFACVSLGVPVRAQSLRSFPPAVDPDFWGKEHRPYIATLVRTSESVDGSGAKREHVGRSKEYRDDAGRVRSEGFYDSGLPMTILLRDPGQMSMISLMVVGRTGVVTKLSRQQPLPPGVGWTVEALPPKMIAGVQAQGERFTRIVPAGTSSVRALVQEDWFSEDLGILLEATVYDPQTGRSTMRVTELQQTTPDAGLFVVPSG